jgi:hypothetical protein
MTNDVYITIAGSRYKVIDALNNITLADSFVKNKLGSGHGEAKLYVGNEGERYREFFDDISRECFFVREDFDKYLMDAKDEFLHPQQEYVKKSEMSNIYSGLVERLASYQSGILKFNMYRKDVEPPRVYMQSSSEYYDLMRALGLPNISYVSVMKLQSKQGHLFYYFRMFVDYKSDIVTYESPMEQAEEKKITESTMSEKKKETLIQARRGQGMYRQKLLEECPFCPISMINDERLLIASHIKPWAKSDDKAKVDPKNGFALSPNYDCMFDNGYMTFDSDKTIIVSPWISPMNQKRLGIYTGMKVPRLPLDDEREQYMIYHRENVYKG